MRTKCQTHLSGCYDSGACPHGYPACLTPRELSDGAEREDKGGEQTKICPKIWFFRIFFLYLHTNMNY